MRPEEAADLVGLLKGLMPRITEDQLKIVGRNIVAMDPARVRPAIERYATGHPDFALAEFLETLPMRPTVGVNPVERTSRRLAEETGLADRLKSEDAAAAALVTSMTDEQLATIRAEILAEMADDPKRAGGVALLAKSDPRTSPMFRRLILSHVKQTGAVPE